MSQAVKRKVGRPRANNKQSNDPAREEILKASAELFGEFGYKGTSTRQIAERVGMRQPSLFHHFGKKENILIALVQEGGAKILNYIDNVDYQADPSIQLYELMTFDAFYLMTEPYRINKLMSMPEVHQGELKGVVQEKRARVIDGYRKLIKKGQECGLFLVEDLEVVTHTIIGMGESIWSWYDRDKNVDATAIAQQIADFGFRSLLLKQAELERIKNQCNLDFLTK